MESLASLEHVQGEVDLRTISFTLDTVESILQVQPEADLLKSSSTGGISLKSGHLEGCVCV